MEINYTPPPTGKKFMACDAKMRTMMGPVGSGKSVTCSFEVIRRASMQAPNAQGIRKTRAAVVRETARQLQDTTIKTFLDWFPPGVCGHFMKTTKTYFFKVGDVECEIMFRALDDADDVANLNSLELTFAWFNECRDIHPDIVDAMSKRIGRFPSKKDGGPTWHGMWGDTNPPTMDTWWYYQMEHLDPSDGVSPNNNGWAVFKQPSGRSPYAENIENLPEGYYDTQGRSDEYIRVYIDGEYGLSSAGMPIYKYFRPDYHMASAPIMFSANGVRPVVIGMDLGLTPAAVIGQQDPRGRALILDELVSFDMGIQRFCRQMLKPLIYERFAGSPILVVTDPAGVQRAQTDERSAIDIIKAEGLKVIPARTNSVTARISAVDDFLMRQVDGDPAFLMDPRCTRLKAAMMGGYRYKLKQPDTIEKNQHSHCFVAGTLVQTPNGGVPIEQLGVGDLVTTPFGVFPVTATMDHLTQTLVDVRFVDGTVIQCTKDHPFYTDRGVVLAEDLQYTDVLFSLGEQLCPGKNTPSKSSTTFGTTANPAGITNPTLSGIPDDTCTKTFGSTITDLYQRVCASTIRTMIEVTTRWKTWNSLVLRSMQSSIWRTERNMIPAGIRPDWKKLGSPQPSGIESTRRLKKGSTNLQSKAALVGKTAPWCSTPASTAELVLSAFLEQTSEDIAALHARQRHESPAELTTKSGSALYAAVISQLIGTGRLRPAPKIAGVSISQTPPRRVYDLTVDQAHSFVANGVWVSNCAEALQYLMLHIGSGGGAVAAQRREIVRVANAGWT